MALNAFLAGAIAMASITISLFFIGFWQSTRDRFFLYLATSFVLEAISRVFPGWIDRTVDDVSVYHLIRLVAYFLILLAIVDKNRPRRKK